MPPKNNAKKSASAQLEGGVAGATTGTGVLALSTLLPENSQFKAVLVFLSPSITVLASVFWSYFISSTKDWLQYRRVEAERKRAHEYVRQAEADPNSSDEYKKKMRQKAEEMNLLLVERQTKRVEIILTLDEIR